MTGQRLEVRGTAPAHLPGESADSSADRTQETFARLLADVVHVAEVHPDSHFFNDLGADSLVMAHFCARVRKRPDLPSVSMRDIYRHPSVGALTAALAHPPTPAPEPATAVSEAPVAPEPPPAGRPHHLLCGVLQVLSYFGYAGLLAVVTTLGYDWISAGSGLLDTYLRSVAFGAVLLVVLSALPVIAKWLLVGRWQPTRFRVWSLVYVRFWLVRTLIRTSPLALFAGTPLFPLYLRALGARVGKGVTFLSRGLPVCTDLLTIGAGTVVRKDSLLSCYRATDGVIETGPVALGPDAVVGEATVLDIGTSLGRGSQLGHASSLHTGQAVPDGERWYGSPAQPGGPDFRRVEPAPCGTARRAGYGTVLLLTALLVYLPVAVGLVDVLGSRVLEGASVPGQGPVTPVNWVFYADLLVVTSAAFFGAVLLAILVVGTVPRLVSRWVVPGRTYPLYGMHHGLHRATALISNRKSLTRLFGDSTSIVHYLRWIGYDLCRIEQTGSNFGTQVKHESPFVSVVGTGTMVADGLSLMNAEYSGSSFRLRRTAVGAHNFLGNRIAYPPDGRTGDNCLLATKVNIPLDGPLRHDVGLLGSPSFEIPRSVPRDSTFDELKEGDGLRRRLAAKNRHNATTMACHLFTGWLFFFCVSLLYASAASLYPQWGTVVVALANALLLPFALVYFVLVERAVVALHPPGPLFCSIYDPRFWLRERYWKIPSETYFRILNGTPFKSVLWRMLGVRVGARVFDDGCSLTERQMVTIGDDCTLNAGSVVQCHSQEDGTFKSDRSAIGSGCTLGVGAFVHYGVTVGDGAELAADVFLMKGETVPAHAHWTGNPARPAAHGDGGET
ncbi:Pls/PosA family non-ribosomal peptide synthetase [Streptomyces sp. NPDC015140]|uniref:Pls/PosA family non-ribosomal peptide synthetase n=1 Tax=Streptomyces sp. NPDC015140 TaxID=3364943 RepID=UPI0036FFF947